MRKEAAMKIVVCLLLSIISISSLPILKANEINTIFEYKTGIQPTDEKVIWNKTVDHTFPAAITTLNNYIYIVGSTFMTSNWTNAFLMKMDDNGNTLFFKTWNGSGYAYGQGMTTIGDYIYVAGYTHGQAGPPSDIFILKYDEQGNLLWNVTWGNYSIGERMDGNGIATDGNWIYVAGNVGGLFLLKFDQNGHLIWNVTWQVDVNAGDRGLTVNGSSVYLTAASHDSNGSAVLLLKYDSNGNLIWSTTWGYGNEYPEASTNYNNSIYITGRMLSMPTLPFCSRNFLIKYDSNGTLLWERGRGTDNCASHAITSQQGVLYLTGENTTMLKYDENGNLLFAKKAVWQNGKLSRGITALGNYRYICGTDPLGPGFILKVGDIPQIVETSPVLGAYNVSLNSNITVSFDQSMDKKSVEDALTSVPTINSTISWSFDMKQMIMHPNTLLLPKTSYNITIAASTRSSEGIPLMSNYILTFTTQPAPPLITVTSPLNGSHDVSVATEILIKFSKSMNQSSVEKSLSIRPQITIQKFEWDEQSTEVRLFAGLNHSTEYQVTITHSATDTEGISLSNSYSFEFTTQALNDSHSTNQNLGYAIIIVIILAISTIWLIILSSNKFDHRSLKKQKSSSEKRIKNKT